MYFIKFWYNYVYINQMFIKLQTLLVKVQNYYLNLYNN